MATAEVKTMEHDENGFLEYLQLQGGEPDLVTKSELIQNVRERGYSLSDRQLTFYMTEGLVPRSVRVGSRAGAYPRVVEELLAFILWARDGGVPIESMKELLPVWKLLVRSRREKTLDVQELEYVARQRLATMEAVMAVPEMVAFVFSRYVCKKCSDSFEIVYKDGEVRSLQDPSATVGFAIARQVAEAEDEPAAPRWIASTRISLGGAGDYQGPTTVVLGLKPNEPLPPDPWGSEDEHDEEVVDCQGRKETV
ncbi:hypothetical protein [Nocardioides aromaticivorans]|uniref:hypothetical protein n=1 Tax=Nocardioides aromaticivorans TaxID=200618 RepID=UPI001A90C4A4|nr:hypothetical protein [Nocardioides aromaticivorans]